MHLAEIRRRRRAHFTPVIAGLKIPQTRLEALTEGT
jgi:hypothetical protein